MIRDVTDRIDLSAPVIEICKRLGLEPRLVWQLRIRPSNVEATVYLLDEDGNKYLGDDDERATETLTFETRA